MGERWSEQNTDCQIGCTWVTDYTQYQALLILSKAQMTRRLRRSRERSGTWECLPRAPVPTGPAPLTQNTRWVSIRSAGLPHTVQSIQIMKELCCILLIVLSNMWHSPGALPQRCWVSWVPKSPLGRNILLRAFCSQDFFLTNIVSLVTWRFTWYRN